MHRKQLTPSCEAGPRPRGRLLQRPLIVPGTRQSGMANAHTSHVTGQTSDSRCSCSDVMKCLLPQSIAPDTRPSLGFHVAIPCADASVHLHGFRTAGCSFPAHVFNRSLEDSDLNILRTEQDFGVMFSSLCLHWQCWLRLSIVQKLTLQSLRPSTMH